MPLKPRAIKPSENYIEINRQLWNEKTSIHVASDFYDVESFIKGKNMLNEPELELLGDVKGRSILHLQCHFGMDTLSLARMGATVTGVDLSDRSIEEADKLKTEVGLEAEFVCCDIFSLKKHLDKQFDIVFTSYGTIGWLPELQSWSEIVSYFLKPGGQFVMADFHPVVWMYDSQFTHIEYSYFNRQAIIEEEEGTYADRQSGIKHTSIGWNHSTAELLQSLTNRGLKMTHFREFDYSPYPCFSKLVETSVGKWQVEGLEGKLPMMYALKFEK